MTTSTPPAARSLSTELASYAIGLRPEDIPLPIRERAALLLLDNLGAGLYGATGDGAAIVHSEAQARYQAGAVPVWGRTTSLSPTAAALVNATQTHAFEFDDYHPGAKL